MYEEDIDDNGAGSVSSEDEIRCVKIPLPEHFAAYLEKKDLCRDVEPLDCDQSLLNKITTNYVIAKKIISNLTWQDKSLCKHVCSMWHSAVLALQKEQLVPVDFAISLRLCNIKNGIRFLKSSNFYTEPLAVFAFTNRIGYVTGSQCESLVPPPCEPACEKQHYLIDMIQQQVTSPKNCMLTMQACYLSYMPLPHSETWENAIRHKMFLETHPFIGGIYIPAIPNVEFTIINIKSVSKIQEDFYNVVNKLAETHYIKGVLVYVNDSFLLHSVEEIIFLNHFKKVQPDVPYALGGCIVEDTISDQNDINDAIDGINMGKDFTSENLISIGMFSVPKNIPQDELSNFSMYSFILESSDWSKAKMQASINKFSKSVPHFEHSVAIKMSCVGRDQKHEWEQQYFRIAFPTTRIVGCYGNGELGVNNPARSVTEDSPTSVKRHCRDPGPQYGVMYSYSTIFVYIGWGKILTHPETK
ncbi:uncharacterized protein LOC142978334 [Anticarsia gemmatalis]|uniref:uncharacterized protein LOC142978334 n=1 Tax=Anticarsia gemmatalis TaxID=129554 RepID=UPI003F773AA0